MRVALYQFAPELGDKAANLARVTRALDGLQCDLVVLPELFSTGYCFRSREHVVELAEDANEGPTSRLLAELARRTGAVIVAGMAEAAAQTVFNSSLAIRPDGTRAVYRKIHLFNSEKLHFAAGQEASPVLQIGSARVAMEVCFDYFFPELARTIALAGVQVICHPANLVLHYAQSMTITRALENRVFWILCNRIGTEERDGRRLIFTGQSQVVSPAGEVLFRAGSAEEVLKVVEIDPSQADDKVVGNNHLFRDRRPAAYRL